MKLVVALSEDELLGAANAGVQRRISALRMKRTDYTIKKEKNTYWEDHIQAAIAEMGVCIAFDQPFSGFVDRGISALADAGPLEVRTVIREGYGLQAKSKDAPHQKLVLTRVKESRVLIEGWATAEEVRMYGTKVMDGVTVLFPDELHSMDNIGLPIRWSQQVRQYSAPART